MGENDDGAVAAAADNDEGVHWSLISIVSMTAPPLKKGSHFLRPPPPFSAFRSRKLDWNSLGEALQEGAETERDDY